MLRWTAIGLGALVLALVLGGVAARFADGPLGPFPGGPFERGERVSADGVDWSFLRDVQEVELQLLEPPRSRTTWVVLHEGRPYVPAGFLDVPLWKQWPHEAARDGRALLRVHGRIYPVRAEKVTDRTVYEAVAARSAEKYGLGGGEASPEDVWFFRLEPR